MSIYWLLPLENEILVHAVVPGESAYLSIGCLASLVKIKKEGGQEDALAELLCFWKETDSWAYTFHPKIPQEKKRGSKMPPAKSGDKEAKNQATHDPVEV